MKKNVIRLVDVPEKDKDLRGKTIVFTDGSDGMELAAVRKLAAMGASLERLKESGSARIVNLSSDMQKYGHIHFDDIQLEKGWTHMKTYAQAKLAMIMCTRRLTRELKETGISVNAMNPGFIKTNLISNLTGVTSPDVWNLSMKQTGLLEMLGDHLS